MIKKVWNFFEKLGCVRAVDSLARQGFHEEAEVLMLTMLIKEADIKLERMDEKYYNDDKKNDKKNDKKSVEFFRKPRMCQSSR